jgi:hypothetical protein
LFLSLSRRQGTANRNFHFRSFDDESLGVTLPCPLSLSGEGQERRTQ